MALWLSVIVVGVAAAIWIFRRAIRKARARCPEGNGLYPECLYVVRATDQQLEVVGPDGGIASQLLSAVTRVVVETNDSGPLGADVWWHWYGSSPAIVCSYPQGATGESAALALLGSFHGVNDDQLRKAMGSTRNRSFTVYERARLTCGCSRRAARVGTGVVRRFLRAAAERRTSVG